MMKKIWQKNWQRKKMADDNRGVTLIELMVAVAIMAVVFGIIMGFFLTSVNLYQRVSREANLQNEAQLTFTQIESLVLNANSGVGLGKDFSGTTGNELYIYQQDDEDFKTIRIYRDGSKLYYEITPYREDLDGNMIAQSAAETSLMSEFVRSFTVDMSDYADKNSINVTLDFENKGRTYSATNTIYLRNQLPKTINGSAETYLSQGYEETHAAEEFTNLRVSPTEYYTWPGTTLIQPFNSEGSKDNGITYSYAPATWDIVSGDTTGITVNAYSGAITLASDASGAVTVRARTTSGTGGDTAQSLEASGTLIVKSYDSLQLTEQTWSDDQKTCTYTLEARGTGLQPSVDMGSTPTVEADSTISASIKRAAESQEGILRWKVTVSRPSDYLNKSYTLMIGYTLNGTKKVAQSTLTFGTAAGESTGVIQGVRLVSDSGMYESGTTPVNLSRGDKLTLKMEVKYEGTNSWTTLAPGKWSIAPDDSGVTVSATSEGYKLSCDVGSGTKKVTCTTSYQSGSQSGSGPTLELKFSN